MTYTYPIIKLEKNQIFVFGSNTEGHHGKGAALWAKQNAGAIYGKASGKQGQSYAIVTKNLKRKIQPSVLKEDIVKSILELYNYANRNPSKNFMVAYRNEVNLNGYTAHEMAKMFAFVSIPSNIVFEVSFAKLVRKYSLWPVALKSLDAVSIIYDTREQKPLWNSKVAQRHKLDYGDYTTKKLMGVYHIERKSLQDLYGSIVQGHRRFADELIGATVHGIRMSVYVEGTRKDFLFKKFPGGSSRKMKGSAIVAIIETMSKRYKFDVVWCGSRLKAKRMMVERFKLEEKKLK